MKTLVIDDEATTRMVLEGLLESRGPVVLTANGEQALKAIEEAYDAGDPFDLVCLDIHMPDMSGLDCLKRLREIEADNGELVGRGSKVMMTTSASGSAHILEAFRANCDAYLVKPITAESLFMRLEQLGFHRPEDDKPGVRL